MDVDSAFEKIPRAGFLRPETTEQADEDRPLSIGFGQSNSQPSTLRKMLSWLDIEPGHKILDVGSGSGWSSALLSYITGPHGEVYAVERLPDLVQFGRENLKRMGIKNVKIYQASKKLGL